MLPKPVSNRSRQPLTSPNPGNSSSTATVAIILLNWRNVALTLDCVRRIQQWQGARPHIIVVDNESTPESRAMLEGVIESGHLVCAEENLGYGGGNNLGIARARDLGAEHFLLLNTDARLDEDNYTKLIDFMVGQDGFNLASPLIYETGSRQTRIYAGSLDIAEHRISRQLVSKDDARLVAGTPYETDFVSGTALVGRVDVFEELGGFYTDYFFSGEVADLCRTLRNAGHRIAVVPASRVDHDLDLTPAPRRAALYYYYSLRNRFLFVARHHHQHRFRLKMKWCAICTGNIFRHLFILRKSRARAAALAMWHGLTKQFGNKNELF